MQKQKSRFIFFSAFCIALGLGCSTGEEEAEEFCSLSGATPTATDVAEGKVTATHDGSAFEEEGDWSPTTGSLTGGLLDIIIVKEESGERTADLIEAGSFPICIPIGERSETVGQANLVEGGYVSDANHDGSLSILAKEGDQIVGRFAFTLANTLGETTSFEDGLFRVGER